MARYEQLHHQNTNVQSNEDDTLRGGRIDISARGKDTDVLIKKTRHERWQEREIAFRELDQRNGRYLQPINLYGFHDPHQRSEVMQSGCFRLHYRGEWISVQRVCGT